MTPETAGLLEFRQIIERITAQREDLKALLGVQGYLRAVRRGDGGYEILLTRGTETPWRVTSFRNGEPVGHRDYTQIGSGSPIQDALQEFLGETWTLVRRRSDNAA